MNKLSTKAKKPKARLPFLRDKCFRVLLGENHVNDRALKNLVRNGPKTPKKVAAIKCQECDDSNVVVKHVTDPYLSTPQRERKRWLCDECYNDLILLAMPITPIE